MAVKSLELELACAVHMTRTMRSLYQLGKRGAGRYFGSSSAQAFRNLIKKGDELHPDSITPLHLPAASTWCT